MLVIFCFFILFCISSFLFFCPHNSSFCSNLISFRERRDNDMKRENIFLSIFFEKWGEKMELRKREEKEEKEKEEEGKGKEKEEEKEKEKEELLYLKDWHFTADFPGYFLPTHSPLLPTSHQLSLSLSLSSSLSFSLQINENMKDHFILLKIGWLITGLFVHCFLVYFNYF